MANHNLRFIVTKKNRLQHQMFFRDEGERSGYETNCYIHEGGQNVVEHF